jgi:hypothetical protein
MLTVLVRTTAGVLLLAASAAFAAETAKQPDGPSNSPKHTLRYKFQPGQTLRWEVTHRARVETTVSGTTQTADTQTTSVKVWRVTAVASDGSATFEHSVESVDMRQKLSGRMETHYNSRTDKTPPVGFETVAKSIGVPLSTITLDPLGKIVKRQTAKPKPGGEHEGQITIPLPEEAVSVGHTWSFPYEIDVPTNAGTIKKVKSLQSFTLEEVKDGVATIRVATQILTPIHDPALEVQLVQREATGVVRFAIASGRVVEQQMEVDKQVIGFSGPASSLHYRTRFTEKYLEESKAGEKTAARPADAK